MIKFLFLLSIAVVFTNANAEVFSCKNAKGETEFSDTPCKAGVSSEVVPDRAPLTEQQINDAQQKAQQQKKEAAEIDARTSAQRLESEPVEQAAPVPADVIDEGTVNNCCGDGRRDTNCCGRLDGGVKKRRIPQPR